MSAETRRRVLTIAHSRRYRPNQQAVALASRKPPDTIGLVMPYHRHVFDSFYFSQIACAVADVTTAHGMDINLLIAREATTSSYLDFLASGRVAGAILLGTAMGDEVISGCESAEVPTVVINNVSPMSRSAESVVCNNRQGALEMTRHLLRLGHTRIAFIAGPPRLLDAHDRLEGYREALQEAGLRFDENLVAFGDYNEKGGRDATRILLSRTPRPTAIFAANDESAIGALQTLKREGLRVPQDVAVAGFDDIPPAQYVEPALTTVHQSFYRLGETAAEVLVARIKGDTSPEKRAQHVLRTRLVIRESCGGRSLRI